MTAITLSDGWTVNVPNLLSEIHWLTKVNEGRCRNPEAVFDGLAACLWLADQVELQDQGEVADNIREAVSTAASCVKWPKKFKPA